MEMEATGAPQKHHHTLNQQVGSITRLLRIKARGYRNRERFKLGVMFHYGKLNMAY